MIETTMPATEAKGVENDQELVAYELAYHVLPTVAEGEVSTVTEALKQFITTAGGNIFDEEVAERFELAYEIEKHLEGRYRHFSSAYFGWLRFRLAPSALIEIMAEVEAHKQILRSLVVKLNKVEEANPFRFHEAVAELNSKVKNVGEEANDSATITSEPADAPEETESKDDIMEGENIDETKLV